jgi:predicted nucleic acid-binding protein
MILTDAGPLVAILHQDDQEHARCVAVFKKLRTVLATTFPPLTEAMYLLGFSPSAQDALLEMVEREALRILRLDEADFPRVRALMQKYHDLPMDFADATLVRVAEREGLQQVFTLDRRDFAAYRVGRRAFTIVP